MVTFREWWNSLFKDLRKNLYYGWPVLAVIVVWVPVSSLLLCFAEGIDSYGNAVFDTCKVVFGSDIRVSSVGGKILFVANAIVGYVLLGFVLWFVIASATLGKKPPQ